MATELLVPKVDNVAYDKSLNTYINFSSRSDALLAGVVLGESAFSREFIDIFDALVEIVTHPEFHKEEVRLRTVQGVSSFARNAGIEISDVDQHNWINADMAFPAEDAVFLARYRTRFESRWDALLAGVVLRSRKLIYLTEEALRTVFDSVVRAGCLPEFERNDVTLNTVEDVMLFVKKQRESELFKIFNNPENSVLSPAQRTTLDGLGHVIDYLMDTGDRIEEAERESATRGPRLQDNVISPFSKPDVPAYMKTVSNIGVVHSSLTLKARKILGRSMIISTSVDIGRAMKAVMYRKMRSPKYGEWTRSLDVQRGFFGLSDIPTLARLLRDVTPNLRSLNLICDIHRGTPWMASYVEAFGRLSCLEELHIVIGTPSKHTPRLLTRFISMFAEPTLAVLESLQSLHLSFDSSIFDFHSMDAHTGLLSHLTGYKLLTHVHLQLQVGIINQVVWTRSRDARPSPFVPHAAATKALDRVNTSREFDLTVDDVDEFHWLFPSLGLLRIYFQDERPRDSNRYQIIKQASSIRQLETITRFQPRLELDLSFVERNHSALETLSLFIELNNYRALMSVQAADLTPWSTAIEAFIATRSCPALKELRVLFYASFDAKTVIHSDLMVPIVKKIREKLLEVEAELSQKLESRKRMTVVTFALNTQERFKLCNDFVQ